ncbi:MAG TPA: hypothetical protein VGM56_09390 [Byssovorax sp.]|jgi:hypothetical protein
MQKPPVIPTLFSILLAAIGLSMFFHLGLRVRVLGAFAAEGASPPPTAALALSSWLQPAACGVALAIAGLGQLLRRRSRKQWALGAAITLVGAAFSFAVVAALAPIFRPG